jgi:hypothetical protein
MEMFTKMKKISNVAYKKFIYKTIIYMNYNIDKETLHKFFLGLIAALIVWQIFIFLSNTKEHFGENTIINNKYTPLAHCDDIWPVYHRNGIQIQDLMWGNQSPKMNLKDNSMCGNLGKSPIGVESKLTASYDNNKPENAIYDNIIDRPYDDNNYMSSIMTNIKVTPTCDCSTHIAKSGNIR